jgi:hypothetical protein
MQQARKKQIIVLQVNGDSFIKYQVRSGKGSQEAQNPRNLGTQISPLSSATIVQPVKNKSPAGMPKIKTARTSLPFHQSKTK